MRVYLCGPINGCTDAECNDWRSAVKQHFPGAIDPMVRDYRGREDECVKEIVELDKEDISKSDVVLVNYSKPSVGTSMELFYAWTLKIPVIVWCAPGTVVSPWMRYHATEFVDSFQDALAALQRWKAKTEAKLSPERVLGWAYHRSRFALFSNKRSERDQALSEINKLTQPYGGKWNGEALYRDVNAGWTGEQP